MVNSSCSEGVKARPMATWCDVLMRVLRVNSEGQVRGEGEGEGESEVGVACNDVLISPELEAAGLEVVMLEALSDGVGGTTEGEGTGVVKGVEVLEVEGAKILEGVGVVEIEGEETAEIVGVGLGSSEEDKVLIVCMSDIATDLVKREGEGVAT